MWNSDFNQGNIKDQTHKHYSVIFVKRFFSGGQNMPSTDLVSEVAQSCLTLCTPMDCSLPSSFLHGILQGRVMEWVAISFSRGSSQPRDQTQVSHIPGRCFIFRATREAQYYRPHKIYPTYVKLQFHATENMNTGRVEELWPMLQFNMVDLKKKLSLVLLSQT